MPPRLIPNPDLRLHYFLDTLLEGLQPKRTVVANRTPSTMHEELQLKRFESHKIGARGFEPPTSWSRSKKYPVASDNQQELTATPEIGCTNGCTSERENVQIETVDALAAALLAMPKAERLRLAKLLLGRDEAKG